MKKDLLDVPKDLRLTLLVRGVFGVLGHIFLITSLYFLEISEAAVIFWIHPMMIAIFANIALKESITKYDWIAIFLAFIGIFLI